MPVLDKNLNHEFSTDITAHFPFPTQRATQTQAMNGVQEAFRGDKKFYILEGPTGFGKCFASDTPVLMYDGTVKMVQNVLVGELLMGDDSTPRRVLSLSHGFDEMFDVVPVKGDAYRVNSRHILSLKFTKGIKTKGTYANNQKSQVPQYRKLGIKVAPVAIIDILLRDYLSLSKTQKHILKGYRVGVEFSAREVSIDPYFLGLWLGDGDSDCPTVTSADNEIGGFLYSYAAALGLQTTSRFHNGACTMALTTGEVGGDPSTRKRNPLLDDLRGLGVLNNKHIPRLYKCNSREIRLKLLAGIIDSDGHHIVRGGYEFVFVVKRLAEDLTYLCRSLGLAAYMEPCEKTCTNGKNGPVTGQYYRVLMSGFGVERIPSMLLRKQSRPRRQKKNPLVTGVQVSSAGNGEFFGFSVDGNGRFLLGDFTVVHNSGVGIAAASWAKSLNPAVGKVYERGGYILSPQKVLTKQYVDDFGSMGLVELKGQANYTCHGFTERAGMEIDCETAAMLYEEEHNIETCTGYKPAKRIY